MRRKTSITVCRAHRGKLSTCIARRAVRVCHIIEAVWFHAPRPCKARPCDLPQISRPHCYTLHQQTCCTDTPTRLPYEQPLSIHQGAHPATHAPFLPEPCSPVSTPASGNPRRPSHENNAAHSAPPPPGNSRWGCLVMMRIGLGVEFMGAGTR